MDETASKVPVTEEKAPERSEPQAWRPFESLRREVYRLFEDFDRDLRRPLRRPAFDVEPFWRRQLKWGGERRKDYYLHERHFGSFERHFALPEGVDTDKIEASFKNGVLTVRLPKKAESIKPRRRSRSKLAK
jgi:HSP20 family protein